MKQEKGYIVHLEPNEIFIFGSNRQGNHAGAAARHAKINFGAIEGVGEGITGNSYAFPTITDYDRYTTATIPELQEAVKVLEKAVNENPEKIFYMTAVGCGCAGLKHNEVAPLFDAFTKFPNFIFPPEWSFRFSNTW